MSSFTGISVAFPKEYEIQIRQGGLAAKKNISVLNTPGTIDSDYGELKIILFNHSNENFVINNNDRVAQMVLTYCKNGTRRNKQTS